MNTTEQKKQEMATKWQQRFTTCEQNQRPLFTQAAKWYDIMYAVMSTTNMAPWRSKVYVPILASKAWDLIARFSDIVPVFKVDIKNETEVDEQSGEITYTKDSNQRTEKIEKLMQDEYYRATGEPMNIRVADTLLDAVVPGTGFAKTPWVYEEKKTYARPFDEDGMITDSTQKITKTVKGGHNDFIPINFFNMFIAPNAQSFFSAPYWIVREYTTIPDAEATGLYDKKALNKLRTNVSQDNTFTEYNRSRNRLVNGKQISEDGTVENIVLYECYDNQGNMYVYGEGKSENGWVELRCEKDMYWHGRPPLVPFYIRRKSFNAWGESLFENNSRLQSATNDLFNHYLDNWNLSIDQMLMYEDGTLTSDFIVKPGGEITYSGQRPEQFKFSDPNPNQLSTVLGVINQAIEAATVPQYLSGVTNSELDKTKGTATGVNMITEAATEKVGFMRNNVKQSMRTVGENWLSNLQQFQDLPKEVPIVKNGVRKPMIVTPGDLQGEMDLDIDDDSMMPISKTQKRQTFQEFTAGLLSLQQAAIQQSQIFQSPQDVPRFNFNELIEDISDSYSVKDFTKYLMPTNTAPQPVAAAAAGAQGAAPAQDPMAAAMGAAMGGGADQSGMEQEQAMGVM